jgi:hypothetical protein
MNDMILSVNTLPEPLHRHIRSDRVRVHEEDGNIILMPLDNANEHARACIDRLYGMFEGKLSADDYAAQKQLDKELEI